MSTQLINLFSKNLTAIEYPKEKTFWNIAGIIKGQNSFYKFDVRDMFQLSSGEWAQKSNTQNKADKMVFQLENEWILIDIEELHKYLKLTKLRIVYLDELIKCLEWTIRIPKK